MRKEQQRKEEAWLEKAADRAARNKEMVFEQALVAARERALEQALIIAEHVAKKARSKEAREEANTALQKLKTFKRVPQSFGTWGEEVCEASTWDSFKDEVTFFDDAGRSILVPEPDSDEMYWEYYGQ